MMPGLEHAHNNIERRFLVLAYLESVETGGWFEVLTSTLAQKARIAADALVSTAWQLTWASLMVGSAAGLNVVLRNKFRQGHDETYQGRTLVSLSDYRAALHICVERLGLSNVERMPDLIQDNHDFGGLPPHFALKIGSAIANCTSFVDNTATVETSLRDLPSAYSNKLALRALLIGLGAAAVAAGSFAVERYAFPRSLPAERLQARTYETDPENPVAAADSQSLSDRLQPHAIVLAGKFKTWLNQARSMSLTHSTLGLLISIATFGKDRITGELAHLSPDPNFLETLHKTFDFRKEADLIAMKNRIKDYAILRRDSLCANEIRNIAAMVAPVGLMSALLMTLASGFMNRVALPHFRGTSSRPD